jgi:acetyltransferase
MKPAPPDVRERLTGRSPETSLPRGLDPFFLPRCVAVIGATEKPGTVGRTVLRNLVESEFRSKTYPVNPKHAALLGLKAYRTIADVPETVDLAIVATPASTVPQIIGK